MTRQGKSSRWLLLVLGVIVVGCLIVGLLLPATQSARESAQRSRSMFEGVKLFHTVG
jgi:hypothetical protein